MKCLISATISPEAYRIYESWPKGSRSNTITDLMVKQNALLKMTEDMKKGIDERNIAIGRVIWELKGKKIHHSLCTDLNELLVNTLHYQYWLNNDE